MIFTDSKTKIFVILNNFIERGSAQIARLRAQGWDVSAYFVQTEQNSDTVTDNSADLTSVTAKDLPALISKDYLKNSSPTLILFEDEHFLNDYSPGTTLPADYRVCRFSEFNFLLGYQHCDKDLLKHSEGAAGFHCIAEKRFFKPGSAAPEMAISHTGSWIIKNQTEDPKEFIFNSYFSPASIQARSQTRIDQPLVSHVWRQQDFLDLAMRRLGERNLSESLWAITQAAKIGENRKFILQLEAFINILSCNRADFDMIRMNLSSKAMLDLPESCLLLADLAAVQGLNKEAGNILEALHAQLPDYALVCQRLARDSLIANDILSARKYLERGLKSDPYNPVLLLDLSQLELQSDRLVEAQALIGQALISPRVESRAFLQKAFIFRKKMRPAETLENLQRYIDLEEAYSVPENSQQSKIMQEIKKEIIHIKSQL